MVTFCSVPLLFLPLLLLLLLLREGAGLVVVRSITSLAGDAGAHTGHEEPPWLSGFHETGLTWFQHRASSTVPGSAERLPAAPPPAPPPLQHQRPELSAPSAPLLCVDRSAHSEQGSRDTLAGWRPHQSASSSSLWCWMWWAGCRASPHRHPPPTVSGSGNARWKRFSGTLYQHKYTTAWISTEFALSACVWLFKTQKHCVFRMFARSSRRFG